MDREKPSTRPPPAVSRLWDPALSVLICWSPCKGRRMQNWILDCGANFSTSQTWKRFLMGRNIEPRSGDVFRIELLLSGKILNSWSILDLASRFLFLKRIDSKAFFQRRGWFGGRQPTWLLLKTPLPWSLEQRFGGKYLYRTTMKRINKFNKGSTWNFNFTTKTNFDFSVDLIPEWNSFLIWAVFYSLFFFFSGFCSV